MTEKKKLYIIDVGEKYNDKRLERNSSNFYGQTAPKIKRKPKWFYVYSDGRDVYVRNAENHKESCVIKGNRRLDGVNANTVYELYLKRKAGVNTAQKENDITLNSSYWFGIFEELGLEH